MKAATVFSSRRLSVALFFEFGKSITCIDRFGFSGVRESWKAERSADGSRTSTLKRGARESEAFEEALLYVCAGKDEDLTRGAVVLDKTSLLSNFIADDFTPLFFDDFFMVDCDSLRALAI